MMKFSVFAISAGLLAGVLAAPAPVPHVVHEKRSGGPSMWKRNSNALLDRSAVMPMSIGLKQRNLDQGHDFLMDVSHPSSPNYGKHWTADQVSEMFSPSAESVQAVKSWLASYGIADDTVKITKGNTWVKFDASVEQAESMLQTKYNVYEHEKTGHPHVACESYSIPADLKNHIDIITPTLHFDVVPEKHGKSRPMKRGVPSSIAPGNNLAWAPKKGATIVAPSTGAVPEPAVTFNLANCNTYITPDCLRALYNIPNGTLNESSYGIVEYTPQAFLQTDLNVFYENLQREIPSGNSPIINLIDGADLQTSDESFDDNGESDLDLEYAISLVYPQTVTLYQVGDEVEGASFNNFLDALDSSYCTYDGGDDSSQDGIYPDTYSGGYKGDAACGTVSVASVISTSYGYNEADLTAAYQQRQCYEYMKLGLTGVSFLYSSGDYGVAGNSGQCCTKAKCAGGTYNSGDSGTFNPSFPATCPYVTAVGATQIKSGASVTEAEEASETVIYSGGGFSNVFAIPSYQSDAVATYFSDHKPSYTSTQYNNSQTVRGYPDISANGANYVVAIDGELELVYGTSASSPTLGSIITLINEQRIAANKSVVGFINPVLYENSDALNDITSGGNEGCGTDGFTAVTGWDPVTGLGTPDYEKLLAVWLALD